MSFSEVMERVVQGFEIVGVAVLIGGSAIAFVQGAASLTRGRGAEAFEGLRQGIGRAILLGLEILIIADIVRTITISQTLENALTLGVIVLVRTFLSFSLEVELEGALPWRRTAAPPSGPDG